MNLLRRLDRSTLATRRWLARTAEWGRPDLGHPLFSARIADRLQRWQVEKQPNLYTPVASKANGIAYMASLGYPVPRVHGVYPSIHQIPPFDRLPRDFVLKPVHAHSAAGVFLMQDGHSLLDRRTLTRDEIVRIAGRPRGDRGVATSGPYQVEELLTNFDSAPGAPLDYKFYCFGPDIVAVQVIRRLSKTMPSQNLHWFVAPDWTRLPRRLRWPLYPERSTPPKPPFLDEMLKIVSDVGARLDIFLRIDMYATPRGPVFGEFTAYPHRGLDYTPWGDAWLGSHWRSRDGGRPPGQPDRRL